MILPTILAGGSGTRLWPLSRELYPKQLLSMVDDRTMLQCTLLRLSGLEDIGPPLVICNEEHRFMVAEQLRQIEVPQASIILEPFGRNTAPAIAVAALHSLSFGNDDLLLVLPADHYLEDISAFHDGVRKGAFFAGRNYLVTFGIVPESPETGYGYIQKGEPILFSDAPEGFHIRRFVEKPDRGTAVTYLGSGDFFWNSGMFVFRASRVLEELERHAPRIVECCRKALEKAESDLTFTRLDPESFGACPSESIDYALMEKTDRGAMVPLSAGWNDIGSWKALWDVGKKDHEQNVIVGDTLTHQVRSSYIQATSRMVAAIGIENQIVVETPDAVLVTTWEHAQEVKLLVQKMKSGNREEALNHKIVYRPWGSYQSLNADSRFQVKRITVKPGAMLSLQKHYHRAEHWVVVRGTALITRGEEEFMLREDESTYIPSGTAHRLANPGKIPLELIEVQSGSYLGEDDIVRLDDVYGR